MNGVSRYQRNGIGNRIGASDVQSGVLDFGYRVRLGSNRVWLTFSESADRNIQVTDVLVGPFNL
jgi:hypothetical protein